MIDLGQYDAIKTEPRASMDCYGTPITEQFVYIVYAEPITFIGEYSTRWEAMREVNKDWDNRYLKVLTHEQYEKRYGAKYEQQ